MKIQSLFIFTIVTVLGMMLSACGATPAPTSANSVGAKVSASPVEFTGTVEAIDGNEVTVDGRVVVVTPEMIAPGNFVIGDVVEVEATIDENGMLVAESVELHNDDMDDDDKDDDIDDDADDSDDEDDDSDDDMDDDSDDDSDGDMDDDDDDDDDDDMDNDSADEMDDDSDDEDDDNDAS